MAINIQSTQGYMQRGGIKIMVYGKRAVGKTPLLATAPNVLIIATEAGLASVRNQNIPYIEVRTRSDVRDVINWLRVPTNIAKYDTIALDGISYLSHTIFSEIAQKAKHNNKVQYYGELVDVLMPLVELLTNELKKNVVFTAWQGDVYHPVTETVVGCEPHTAGKALANYLMHFFDVTAHMQKHDQQVQGADGTVTVQQVPYLQTGEANGVFARDRTGKLALFEPANLTELFNKLNAQ